MKLTKGLGLLLVVLVAREPLIYPRRERGGQ
jgi:hypothetical protein